MARPSEIEQLERRRLLLLAESEYLRRRFAGDLDRFQAAAAWLDTGFSVVQSLRAYWPLFAAGAGFLATRKRRGWLRSLGKLWTLWKVARRFWPLWRLFSSTPSAPASSSGEGGEGL